MKKIIRILHIFGEPLSNGGQESYLMNMYRNIDRNKIIFDFFSPYYCDNENMKNEIEGLGGKVYIYNGRFNGEGNILFIFILEVLLLLCIFLKLLENQELKML